MNEYRERSSRTVWMPLTLLALQVLLAVPALPAQLPGEPIPDIHLQRARIVAGGFPMRGMENGVLLERLSGPLCQGLPLPEAPPPTAIATSVDREVRVELTLGSCTQTRAEPLVSCDWQIFGLSNQDTPILSDHAEWQGWSGQTAMRAPSLTGAYRATMNCLVDGKAPAIVVERDLYVTYREPTPLITLPGPPPMDWYSRGTTWAPGFTAAADEQDVLKALVANIYQHGWNSWQYGCFQSTSPLVLDRDSFCYCMWAGLVPFTNCQFANCYQFSDVFEVLASTLGIGAFGYTVVEGEAQAGFMTVTGIASIDPLFTGNTTCNPGMDLCPSYVFGSHNMRFRDGLYYDTTFGSTYRERNKHVAMSLMPQQDICRPSMESPTTCLYELGRGYGYWRYWKVGACNEALCSPSEESDASEADASGESESSGESETPNTGEGFAIRELNFVPPADFANLPHQVSLQLTVNIPEGAPADGQYELTGTVTDKDGRLVANRGSWGSPSFALARFQLSPGEHVLPFMFSGQQFYKARNSQPPLHASLQLAGEEGVVARFSGTLPVPKNDWAKFGEVPGEVNQIEQVGLAEDGTLQVRTCVAVRETEPTVLQLRLSKHGQTLAYAGALLEPAETGKACQDLTFTVPPGAQPPFEVVAGLYQMSRQGIMSTCTIIGGEGRCSPGWEVGPPSEGLSD